MAEVSLKDYVLRGMAGRWELPVKHADAFTAGIADLSAWIAPAGNIWIELKSRAIWPRKEDSIVKFELDALQKRFLVARRGWCLCRCAREYLLFTHAMATRLDTQEATRAALYTWALAVWKNRIDWKEFAECVSRRYI